MVPIKAAVNKKFTSFQLSQGKVFMRQQKLDSALNPGRAARIELSERIGDYLFGYWNRITFDINLARKCDM